MAFSSISRQNLSMKLYFLPSHISCTVYHRNQSDGSTSLWFISISCLCVLIIIITTKPYSRLQSDCLVNRHIEIYPNTSKLPRRDALAHIAWRENRQIRRHMVDKNQHCEWANRFIIYWLGCARYWILTQTSIYSMRRYATRCAGRPSLWEPIFLWWSVMNWVRIFRWPGR